MAAADGTDRVDAYASALFEVAKAEGSLETVEDELFRVARTLESRDDLRGALTDQRIPVETRQGIVEDLLTNRASPVTTSLVSFVVGAGQGRHLSAIIDRLVQRAAEERQQAVADVRTAVPIGAETLRRLTEALSKATGKQLSVKVTIDPTILGGVIAQIGDTYIDGSVRHSLELLRESL